MQDRGRVVTLRGRSFRIVDDKPTFWDKAEAGFWEPETLAAIEAAVKPGDAFLDIGAWVGPTALFAATLGAIVVAVEADPVAHAALSANVAANPDLSARMTLVHAAAAASEGEVRLGAARKRGDSMSSALLAGKDDSWTVPAVTPAALFAKASPRPGGRWVAKVDIEGGEYGLAQTLAAALPAGLSALLLALHPRLLADAGRTPEEIASATGRLLEAFGGLSGSILETGAAGHPLERVALRENITVLWRRSVPLKPISA